MTRYQHGTAGTHCAHGMACAGSNEDLASMVEKLLAKEKVLLKKV